MQWIIFIKGAVLGLLLCAPVGPIGILSLRRTLIEGRMAGLLSVLGASTVDGLYCLIAGLGITYISNFLSKEKILLQLMGSLVLIILGIRIFYSKSSNNKTPENNAKGRLHAFSSAFLLMLANPMPILVFTALFTALGIYVWEGDYLFTATLIAGVFAGSAVWAPILVTAVSFFRLNFNAGKLQILNRISGLSIFLFGVMMGILALIW